MILYIDSMVKFAMTNYPGITDEHLDYQYEEVQYMRKVMDELCISYEMDVTESGVELYLYQQKISLDEINMNKFISLIVDMFDPEFAFKYGNYGGAGCDFSLRLEKK